MSKRIIICAVLVFFALSMNVALSDMVYPPELMEVSAPYPESQSPRPRTLLEQ